MIFVYIAGVYPFNNYVIKWCNQMTVVQIDLSVFSSPEPKAHKVSL